MAHCVSLIAGRSLKHASSWQPFLHSAETAETLASPEGKYSATVADEPLSWWWWQPLAHVLKHFQGCVLSSSAALAVAAPSAATARRTPSALPAIARSGWCLGPPSKLGEQML